MLPTDDWMTYYTSHARWYWWWHWWNEMVHRSAPSEILMVFMHVTLLCTLKINAKNVCALDEFRYLRTKRSCNDAIYHSGVKCNNDLCAPHSIEPLQNCSWGLCQWTYHVQINGNVFISRHISQVMWSVVKCKYFEYLLFTMRAHAMAFKQFQLNLGQSWIRYERCTVDAYWNQTKGWLSQLCWQKKRI